MKRRYLASCAMGALVGGWAGAGYAADAASDAPVATAEANASGTKVEELVVTAQRRDENVEKVPLTVQAFTGATLRNLNVTTLDSLLKFTPNVTYGNNGPGQGNIFIRGLSAGFAGNQSSATAGNFPNVAIYLDDQSFQFPARNVDIYMADMQRVEVLEGPQGTLFGGGAEAGAVRYITNKPNLSRYEGYAEGAYGFTTGGAENGQVTATVNIPVIEDKFAIRAVFYDERQGGYIDNVPSTFTRANSDLGNYYFNIKPTAGLCPNGLPAGSAGLCTLPGAPQANNYAIAQKDQNPTTYLGGRISLAYKINDDWDILIAQSLQNLDAEGLSAQYPIGSDFQPLQPLQVTAFAPSYDKDNFENTAWTVNGKIGPLHVVYTGGYLDRHISQQMEYSNYSRTGGGMYYQCTGGGNGLLGGGPATCYSPVGYWQDTVTNTHLTQELRFSTPSEWRFRAIGGFFYEDFKIYDVQNFNYKTVPSCTPANLDAALAGGAPCLANVTTAPGSTANDPGERSDSTAFGEDTQRGYDQYAFFGSADYDVIPNVLTLTGGLRYYNYDEYEVGSQYATTSGCLNVPNGQCTGGLTNIDNAHDQVTYKGVKFRASINWHANANTNAYFTFSQGFRPGGFNRSTSAVAPLTTDKSTAQYEKPNGYSPDSLNNYEIGLKTQLFEQRLQLNLSAYIMDWDNVQFLFFNPTQLGNTTFGVNGPNYNIKGFEAQFVAVPIQGLNISGGLSYNNNTQSNSPCLVSNISTSPTFGQCITQVKNEPFQNPFGIAGSVAAFSPHFQGNLRARYDWTEGEYRPFVAADVSYISSQYNQPATYLSGENVLIPNTTYLRYLQPGYAIFDAQVGVAINKYQAELFCQNLGNSNASTFTSSAQFIKSEVPVRPRTFGLKISASF